MQSKIISIDIYKRDVMVCFCDKVMLERKLRQYDINHACLQEILDDIDDSSIGRSFAITDSGPFLLWMPRIPETAVEFGTLSHEVFHTVCFIMGGALRLPCGVSYREDTKGFQDYFFFLKVSITVVAGRLSASLRGMNLPVLASRPLMITLLFLAIKSLIRFCGTIAKTKLDIIN